MEKEEELNLVISILDRIITIMLLKGKDFKEIFDTLKNDYNIRVGLIENKDSGDTNMVVRAEIRDSEKFTIKILRYETDKNGSYWGNIDKLKQ